MPGMERWLSCVKRQPPGPGKVAKKIRVFDEVVAGAGRRPQFELHRRLVNKGTTFRRFLNDLPRSLQ